MKLDLKNRIKNYYNDYKINVNIITIYLTFVFFSQIFIRSNNTFIIIFLSILSFIISFFISLLSSFFLYNIKNKNFIRYE